MSIVQTKGTLIANADATPKVVIDSKLQGGVLHHVGSTEEAPILATVGDNVIFAPLPVDAILHDVIFASDDLGSTGTLDIGFYKKNADGTYVAVDSDALAVAIDVKTAAVAPTSKRFSAKNIDTANKKVWELAGLSAKPAYPHLFLAVTASEVTTAAGTINLRAAYTE